MAQVETVILAAGRGSRMRSGLAKALHELGGVPLARHVVRSVARAGLSKPWVVVGYQGARVEEALEGDAQFVTQTELRGTGDAVAVALAHLPADTEDILVLVADCPLIPDTLIADLIGHHRQSGAEATIVSTIMDQPEGYGRVVRNRDGSIAAIVEDKEADETIRALREVNTGMGIWKVQGLAGILERLPWHGQERYLTEAVQILIGEGKRVDALVAPDPSRVMGINSRRDLAQAEAHLRQMTLERLLDGGVTIVDPATTFVDAEVEVEPDTVLYPMTFLRGKTKIGRECHIGPMTTVISSRLGDRTTVTQSVVEHSSLATNTRVGPFSHLRAGTHLDRDVHIGNYVELKNTRVGIGTKANHHSYLGDATIGSFVNIGAGTVVVNYDGKTKHPTFIGNEAFIGCNVNLVAPVEIGPGAYVAAGSTVNQNVPGEALAIARARQENKPGWAKNRKNGH